MDIVPYARLVCKNVIEQIWKWIVTDRVYMESAL